ncbi:MAG: N-formylglutamate amidohydrolase [Beijerinckiaceae bacterium]
MTTMFTPDHAPEAPVTVVPGSLQPGVLILCDHASNAMPAHYGNLGMGADQLQRHIAYDIGAAAATRAMAQALDCPALLTNFSRLLIDPNRGRDDPTLVMRLSDGAIVPGNRDVDAAEIARRVRVFYDPYDRAISAELAAFKAAGIVPVVVSMHSFTPQWKGKPRPWHVGILWDCDPRLPVPFLHALAREPDLVVGDNEPYDGALKGDTIDRHCTRDGLASLLIEVRQDLMANDADAARWGEKLAALLRPLLDDPVLRVPNAYVSRAAGRVHVAPTPYTEIKP